jgi:uncharacterized protein
MFQLSQRVGCGQISAWQYLLSLADSNSNSNSLAAAHVAARYWDGGGVCGVSHDVVLAEKYAAQALPWLLQNADAGCKFAQCGLAALHARGVGGMAVDQVEAVRLWTLSANQGHADAQCSLGASLGKGGVDAGVTVDRQESVRWLRLAAKRGHAASQYHLAMMLKQIDDDDDDDGEEEDEAMTWLRIAAGKEHARAPSTQTRGHIFFEGNGVPVDKLEAVKWFRLGADQSDLLHGLVG